MKVKSPKLKVKLALSPKKLGGGITKSKGSTSTGTDREKKAPLKSVSETGSKGDDVAGNDVETGSKQTDQEAEMTSSLKSEKIK